MAMMRLRDRRVVRRRIGPSAQYIYIYKYAFIDVLPLQVTTNFLNPLNIYKYIYNLI